MIGGVDVQFWVRDSLEATDLILRTVRRHWPNLVFQNADDETISAFPKTGAWTPKPCGREFFLYRDETAAQSWQAFGAIPENVNTMLYVILGTRRDPDSGLKSLTLVCGELTGEMGNFVEELGTAIDDLNRMTLIDQEAA